MWTGFSDNNTCGRQKLSSPYLVIEANLDNAIDYIEKKFYYNPYGSSCSCCGDDYKIKTSNSMHESLDLTKEEFDCLVADGKIIIASQQEVKMKLSLIS